MLKRLALVLGLVLMLGASEAAAQGSRLALVVGNADYQDLKALETPVRDARLVGDALRRAGFDVTERINADERALRRSLVEFVARVNKAGTDAVALVYLSGYGVLSDGANFLLPVDARIATPEDLVGKGLALDDVINAMAASSAIARIVLVDSARIVPDLDPDQFGAGLGAVLLPEQIIVGFSAQPGAIAIEGDRNSPYATALARSIGTRGVHAEEVLRQVRCDVYRATEGAQIPWSSSTLIGTFTFTEGQRDLPDACPVVPEPKHRTARRVGAARSAPVFVPVPSEGTRGQLRLTRERIRELPPEEAYVLVVEDGSVAAYEYYVEIYPHDPRSRRFRERLAARVEEEFWLEVVSDNTPEAYALYLRRYPYGAHRRQALIRLHRLGGDLPYLPPLPPDYDDYDDRHPVIVGPGTIFRRPVYDYYPGPAAPTIIVDIEVNIERLERRREGIEEQISREQSQTERGRLIRERERIEALLRRERQQEYELLQGRRNELDERLRREERREERARLQRQREELEARLQERGERVRIEGEREQLGIQLRQEQNRPERERIERERERLREEIRRREHQERQARHERLRQGAEQQPQPGVSPAQPAVQPQVERPRGRDLDEVSERPQPEPNRTVPVPVQPVAIPPTGHRLDGADEDRRERLLPQPSRNDRQREIQEGDERSHRKGERRPDGETQSGKRDPDRIRGREQDPPQDRHILTGPGRTATGARSGEDEDKPETDRRRQLLPQPSRDNPLPGRLGDGKERARAGQPAGGGEKHRDAAEEERRRAREQRVREQLIRRGEKSRPKEESQAERRRPERQQQETRGTRKAVGDRETRFLEPPRANDNGRERRGDREERLRERAREESGVEQQGQSPSERRLRIERRAERNVGETEGPQRQIQRALRQAEEAEDRKRERRRKHDLPQEQEEAEDEED